MSLALSHELSFEHQPEGPALEASEISDPVLLKGDELYEYIVTKGLTYIVSANPLGAVFVNDVAERLGARLHDVTVNFTSDPVNAEQLVANFLPRIDR